MFSVWRYSPSRDSLLLFAHASVGCIPSVRPCRSDQEPLWLQPRGGGLLVRRRRLEDAPHRRASRRDGEIERALPRRIAHLEQRRLAQEEPARFAAERDDGLLRQHDLRAGLLCSHREQLGECLGQARALFQAKGEADITLTMTNSRRQQINENINNSSFYLEQDLLSGSKHTQTNQSHSIVENQLS